MIEPKATSPDDTVAIWVENLTLELPVMRGRISKRNVSRARSVGGRLNIDPKKGISVTALDQISFQIKHGERVGLVGRNGAGKSTLLRVLAGIYTPTSGACAVRGSISTMFSTSLGLNRDASGLENIFLAGTLLGLRKQEIEAILPEIVDFCELGEFLNLPMWSYSTGMTTRLAFAIATSINPDVLLIDEVFGAGDRAFQTKAQERIESIMKNASTLVMASHADAILRQFCTSSIWLDQGQVRSVGKTEEVLAAYQEYSVQAQSKPVAPPESPAPVPTA